MINVLEWTLENLDSVPATSKVFFQDTSHITYPDRIISLHILLFGLLILLIPEASQAINNLCWHIRMDEELHLC